LIIIQAVFDIFLEEIDHKSQLVSYKNCQTLSIHFYHMSKIAF